LGIAQRLERLRRILAERHLDGILITQPENCRYLSGFTGSSGAAILLVSHQVEILATDFIHFEQAKQEAPDFDLLVLKPDTNRFAQLLKNQPHHKLAFESGAVSYAESIRLDEAAKETNVQTEPVEGLVESLRTTKDPEEITLIERAAHIADQAVVFLASAMKPGLTEKEAAWMLEKYIRENGSDPLPFEVIVASGPNAALPHARPTDRALAEGEPIVCDLGARSDGYASDLSRTFLLGQADNTFVRVYDLVLAAQTRAISEVRSGMTGSEADRLARDPIDAAGLSASFGHGLGHGVGLAVHESPRLGPRSNDSLTDGMVFTVEPAVYITGWGGVRIEDTLVMEGGRARALTAAPKKRAEGEHRAE